MENPTERVFVYSNLQSVLSSPADFHLHFGTKIPTIITTDSGEKKLTEESNSSLAIITMSPQQFKVFTKMCVSQLEQYEKKNGELNIMGTITSSVGLTDEKK